MRETSASPQPAGAPSKPPHALGKQPYYARTRKVAPAVDVFFIVCADVCRPRFFWEGVCGRAMGEAILERCRILISKETAQLQRVGEDGRSLISTASSAATDAVQAASAAAHQVSSTRRPLCMFVCHLSVSICLMRHAHRVSARSSQMRPKTHRRRRAQGLQQAGQEADSLRHARQLPGGLDGRRLHRGSRIPLCPRLMLEH